MSLNCMGLVASRIRSATLRGGRVHRTVGQDNDRGGLLRRGRYLASAFRADEEGEWRYRLHGEGVEIRQEGRLKCVAPRGHGFIGIHPQNPYAFAHADGTRSFPWATRAMGCTTTARLHRALRREYLETPAASVSISSE